MKASERKKNKFKAIKESLEMIRLHKNQIRFFYPLRNEKGTLARYNFEKTIEKLHRELFALRAVEKQIKMPVKVVVRHSQIAKYHWEDWENGGKPTAFFDRYVSYYCPCCGDLLANELVDKTIGLNYCHRCGQKLWWNQ